MELLSLFIVVILGLILGTISGLIPGIHINMISILVLVNFSALVGYFSIEEIVIFIAVLGLTHTFLDFIPSVLFGVPSSDTSLSVLPGHALALEGRAYMAVYLSSLGSFLGIGFAFLMTPLFFLFLEGFYEWFKLFVPYLLLLVVFALILAEKGFNDRFWAFTVVLFASGYGALVLNSNLIDDALLVLFSGVFGLSSLIYSLREGEELPEQGFENEFKLNLKGFKMLFAGGIAASLCSVSPGLGNAQAASISSVFFKKLNNGMILLVLGSLNTINFILSFVTLYLIERARNGAIFVVSQIMPSVSFELLLFVFLIIFFVGIIAFFLSLVIAKFIVKKVYCFDLKKINIAVIVLIFLVVALITGVIGTIAFVGAGALGLLCISLGLRRVHLMSVLIIPIALNLI